MKLRELKYIPGKIWMTIKLLSQSHKILGGKYIYKSHELKFSDQFKQLVPLLTEEFLKAHPNFTGLTAETPDTPGGVSHLHIGGKKWKVVAFKYINKWMLEEGFKEKYPTAIKMIDMLQEYCPIGEYSVLESGGEITVHSGIENRASEYIRYHIPLIIPKGKYDKLGFECMGEYIGWDDVWAFDNQGLHTAWNRTNEHRLVFLIDVHRSIAGLPPSKIPHIKDKELEHHILLLLRSIRHWYFNITGKNSNV